MARTVLPVYVFNCSTEMSKRFTSIIKCTWNVRSNLPLWYSFIFLVHCPQRHARTCFSVSLTVSLPLLYFCLLLFWCTKRTFARGSVLRTCGLGAAAKLIIFMAIYMYMFNCKRHSAPVLWGYSLSASPHSGVFAALSAEVALAR